MTGTGDREALYGPAGTERPVPAGPRREALYARRLEEAAAELAHSEAPYPRPDVDGPRRHSEAPYPRELADTARGLAAPDVIAQREAQHVDDDRRELADRIDAHIGAELARAYADAARDLFDRLTYGTGAGPQHPRGILAAPDAPRPPARPVAAQVADGRHREPLHAFEAPPLPPAAAALLARITGRPTPAPACPPPAPMVDPWRMATRARHVAQEAAGPADLLRRLLADHGEPMTTDRRAHTLAELAEEDARALDGPRLDARDRHAVAILAKAGPVALTGRPVHALQLADGRAFTLHTTDGRHEWRPTGPAPLIGAAGPAPQHEAPQRPPAGRRDVDEDTPELAAAAYRAARDAGRLVDVPSTPQDVARELAGPSTSSTGPQAGTRAAGPQDEATEHPRAWVARALDAAPGFEVAGAPVHAFELADGTTYRHTVAGWQLVASGSGRELTQDAPRDVDEAPWCPITGRACTCAEVGPCPPTPDAPPLVGILAGLAQEAPQDVDAGPQLEEAPQDGPREAAPGSQRSRTRDALQALATSRPRTSTHTQAGPLTPGEAPQDDSGRQDGPREAGTLAGLPLLVDDTLPRDAVRLVDVERLAEHVREAGTWSVPRYAMPRFDGPRWTLPPLHAFTDAIERQRAQLDASGLPWPAPDERPGDREALHGAQEAPQLAPARTVCTVWQEPRAGRVAFSCDCAGEHCPNDPRRHAPHGEALHAFEAWQERREHARQAARRRHAMRALTHRARARRAGRPTPTDLEA